MGTQRELNPFQAGAREDSADGVPEHSGWVSRDRLYCELESEGDIFDCYLSLRDSVCGSGQFCENNADPGGVNLPAGCIEEGLFNARFQVGHW